MMPGRGSAAAEHSSASSKLLSALTGSLPSPHDNKKNNNKHNNNNKSTSSSSSGSNNNTPQQAYYSCSASSVSSSCGDFSTSTSTTNVDTVALKWHLKLKECEHGRKATVEAKLLAIRDHLTALMNLTTAAHQETAAIHRFLLGMVLAQEQMADAFQTTTTSTTSSTPPTAEEDGGTDKSLSMGGKQQQEDKEEEENSKTKGEQHPGSPSTPTTTTALIPTLSLEQSNEIMEQKLQSCAADIRRDILMGASGRAGTDDSSSIIIKGDGTGLCNLLSTLQQQIRDLKRGQDYAEQLEDLQKRIQKAWDSYLIRANVSLELGGPSPQGTTASLDGKSKKKRGKDVGALDFSSSSSLSLSVCSSKTKDDLWLAEWYYRNLVSKQALAWDKASTRLANLFRSVRETECQRRINLREYLISFSEFQQKLFVGMEAASNIALTDYTAAPEPTKGKTTIAGDASTPADAQPDETKSNDTATRGRGLFGGFQQKLISGMGAAASNVSLMGSQSEAATVSGLVGPTATPGTLGAREEAALRKEIEDSLQTNIHQHLEQHPSLNKDIPPTLQEGQQKDGDKGNIIAKTDGPVEDRDNILGFYQDIFPPESPLESDHVVLSTVVEKNKGFARPDTGAMVPKGLALMVFTTDNTIHLFDLRDDENDDETTTTTTTSNRLYSLSPKQAYRELLEQNESEQEVSPAQSSTPQSIKSRMVEYAISTTTPSSSLSASKHATRTSRTPEPMDGPEPSVSLPLLECTLDTLHQENSIELVHENSSTSLELLLPSTHEQVDMINAFHRQTVAAVTGKSTNSTRGGKATI